MKKRILIALIILTAIVGYFYLTKEEDNVKKSVEVWKAKDLPLEKDVVMVKNKDKNGSTINQKPIIKLRVKDNMGTMAKGSIPIDVFSQYDKKIYYEHRDYHFRELTYFYYNDEGNVTKEIHESKNGIEVKEYFYTDGKLQSMSYKQYYGESNLQEESITRYDKFGNKVEILGKNKEYFTENRSHFETFLVRYKWDKEGRELEEYKQRDGKVQNIVKFTYHDEEVDVIVERYRNGQLAERLSNLYNYSDDGKLLNEIIKEYDAKSETTKISYDRALTYNENGTLEREEVKRDGKIENSIEYRYNNGKLSQEIAHNSDGTIDSSTKYNYNTNGLLTKKKIIGADGDIERIELYTYNSEGKETSQKLDYDGDGSIDSVSNLFYDREGNRIKREAYNNGVLYSFTRYNSSGKKVESSSSSNFNRRFFYDEETGLLSKFILEYKSGRKIIRFYDKNGDLIQELDENGKEYYHLDER